MASSESGGTDMAGSGGLSRLGENTRCEREYLKLNTRSPFFAIYGPDGLDGPDGQWRESKPHDTRNKGSPLPEMAPLFFRDESFLPRFVCHVRQVCPVRQSRKHYPLLYGHHRRHGYRVSGTGEMVCPESANFYYREYREYGVPREPMSNPGKPGFSF